MSAVQFALFWAALAVLLSGGAAWAVELFMASWVMRAGAAVGVDHRLGLAKSGLATPAPIWLLPLRDIMSMMIMLASYGSDRVEWRGQMLHVRTRAPLTSEQAPRPARAT